MMKSFERVNKAPSFEVEQKDEYETIEKIIKKNPFIQKAVEDIKSIDEGVTLRHSMEMAELVIFIADKLHLSQKERDFLIAVALTHDVGKKFINKDVLNKIENYNSDDAREMAKHTELGADYLLEIGAPEEVAEIARQHHKHKEPPGSEKNENENENNDGVINEELKQKKLEFDRLTRIFSIVDIIQATGDSARPYNHSEEALVKREKELSVFQSLEERKIILLLKEKEKKLAKEKFNADFFQKAA